MWQYVEYLKSPQLVVTVQGHFGIKYNSNKQLNEPNVNKNLNVINHTLSKISQDTITNHVEETYLEKSESNNKYHKRNDSWESQTTSEYEGSTDSDVESIGIEIKNKFWYYLFIIGTALGDELFYATFIPFWFWNIDGAVGRRVVFVWSVVMYVGQGSKDKIRWPRPGPPCIRLQSKWAQEYGMPSTHAMVAISIPLSILIYTSERYNYNLVLGTALVFTWCSVICLSRIYLGMHSVLDIVVGLVMALVLMVPLIPLANALDGVILTSTYSPLFVLLVSILLIWIYPSADKWTPTRGDTTMTTSVCAGIEIGAWLNYRLGRMASPTLPPPYTIIWPSWSMLGLLLLRTTLGLCCILATRAICKSMSYALVCTLLRKDPHKLQKSENSLQNRSKLIVELSYKYFTCAMIGFNTVFLLPNVFQMLGIERPTFYTEI